MSASSAVGLVIVDIVKAMIISSQLRHDLSPKKPTFISADVPVLRDEITGMLSDKPARVFTAFRIIAADAAIL